MAAETRGPQFRDAFENRLLPALDGFAPEPILVSAGFDAPKDDPMAQLRLQEDDFAWTAARIKENAETHARGRSVEAHLQATI